MFDYIHGPNAPTATATKTPPSHYLTSGLKVFLKLAPFMIRNSLACREKTEGSGRKHCILCDGQSEPNPVTQAQNSSLVVLVVNSHAPRGSRQEVKACVGFLPIPAPTGSEIGRTPDAKYRQERGGKPWVWSPASRLTHSRRISRRAVRTSGGHAHGWTAVDLGRPRALRIACYTVLRFCFERRRVGVTPRCASATRYAVPTCQQGMVVSYVCWA